MVAAMKERQPGIHTMAVMDVARSVMHMASLPLDTNVLTMTIMANRMPYVGRG
jgi:NADP-dependent 3-hydroxy acid dehydrogenase YdfG